MRALAVLAEPDPARKAAAATQLRADFLAGAPLDTVARLTPTQPLPGRPARPALKQALQVPSRSPFTIEGRAALIHAICHIEFNAINIG